MKFNLSRIAKLVRCEPYQAVFQ